MSDNIRVYQDHTPRLGKRVYVDPQACVIGKVTLGDDCSVWPMAAIRGDVHRIDIGPRTNVQDGAVLHVTSDTRFSPGGRPLIIGAEVTIGHGAILHACTLGDRVLVGMGATVLDGAVVENEVIIGAGSLVPPDKRLESGWLYLGSPARPARPLKDEEREFLAFSAAHYVELKDDYLGG